MSKMKTVLLTALVTFAPAAMAQTAPASTPQAAMTQFCSDLNGRGWKAAFGNMLGLRETTVAAMLNDYAGDDINPQAMDDLFRKSRCEVLSSQGQQIRVRTSGPDAVQVSELVMKDEAVLRVMLANMQGNSSDAELKQAVMNSVQKQYRTAQIKPYVQTLNIGMEKMNGRWVISDGSLDGLMDALTGGMSRLD